MSALYLHVPFRAPPTSSEASNFVAAVGRELERCARSFPNTTVRTLYVAGRPALLPAPALRSLLTSIAQQLDTSTSEEGTLEVHPANEAASVPAALRTLGVTRLSIDARSLEKEALHRRLRATRDAGFESVSLDLFFGGPEQSLSTWKARLHHAVTLRVPHVTLHEHTPERPPHDAAEHADHFAFAMRFLDAKGYEQYELTHFARPGHRSQYQEHVYAHGNVLGLGPGAESFRWPDRSDPSTARRWANVTDPATYVDRLRNDESPIAQQEDLDRRALTREYILLRLRTSDGIELDVLEDRYELSLRDQKAATLDRLAAEGLIHDDPNRVRLTPRGRLLADAVTERLIRET